MDTFSLTKEAKIYNGKKDNLEQVVLGKLVNHMWKNDTKTVSNTLHKNKLKMD